MQFRIGVGINSQAFIDQRELDGTNNSEHAAAALALEAFKTRNKDLLTNYRTIAAHFKAAFDLGLADAARQRGPAAKPSTAAWNDPWHGWEV